MAEVEQLELKLQGFNKNELDSPEIRAIKDSVKNFYLEKLVTDDIEYLKFVQSTAEHVSRVALNVEQIYQELGLPIDEGAYVAALCHDIGRLKDKPKNWNDKKKNWHEHKNKNHHIYSSEICHPLLLAAGYQKEKAHRIKNIVLSHNYEREEGEAEECMLEEKVIQIADKMDKFSKNGVRRLFSSWKENKRYRSNKKLIDSVSETMEKWGYTPAKRFKIVDKLLDKHFLEGKAELEEIRKENPDPFMVRAKEYLIGFKRKLN